MKSYNEETIKLLNNSILQDEFDDTSQNKTAYNNKISGWDELKRLVEGGKIENNAEIVNIGSGRTNIEELFSDGNIYYLEPCPQRKTESTFIGWCENIPEDCHPVDLVLCWGTFCFVRGIQETLVEFNRVLRLGGRLIMDTVSYTTMPLAQTVQSDCFIRYMELFGFHLEEKHCFGENYHRRVGYRFMKFEDFNPAKMRMPQSTGEIKNYLPERDWYLK